MVSAVRQNLILTAGANAPPRSLILRETLVATGAGVLVLLASFANFLGHQEYPLLRPEVGLAVLVLVAAAASVGLLYAVVGQLGRLLLQHVLVFIALDINFGTIVAVIGMAAMAFVLRDRMMPFLAIAAGVVLATGLAAPVFSRQCDTAVSVPAASGNADLPLLIHIILDEHIGIEGLLGESAGTVAIRDKLKAFYADNGFRLFGGAYSRYFHTANSIPEVLNFGAARSDPSAEDVATNAYFDRLGEMGYRIQVWQTDFLRYCDNPYVVACHTRRAYDANMLVDAPIPPAVKARVLIEEMAKISQLALVYDGAMLAGRYAGLPLPFFRVRDRLMPTAVGALDTIGALTGVLREARPGEAYFIHELVPHHPFVLTPDCGFRQVDDWFHRSGLRSAKGAREQAYFDQISCLNTRLQGLLDAVSVSPAGTNAIFVIHGDHGSRITDTDPTVEAEGRFTDADLIAGHSALFAVKAPGIAPGYDSRRQPVARLLGTLINAEFARLDLPDDPDPVHSVVLENDKARPITPHMLPEWWTQSQ